MWRRAHGRLAAIVVLAGGLSSCMPTPAPRRAASVDDDDDHDNDHTTADMHCGYIPSVSRDTLVGLIEKEVRERCGASAVSGNRFGEIRVVGRVVGGGVPAFETEGGEDLSDEDRRCVAAAAHLAMPEHPYGDFAEAQGLTLDLTLGTPPPLFPSTLFDRWLRARNYAPARKRFAAELPPEVVLQNDDCLSISSRPAVYARLDRWLAAVDTPLDKTWQPGRELFRDLEAESRSWTRAWLLSDELMMISRRGVTDPPRQEICLVPLDDRVRRELQGGAERRATCLAGDLREILLHPRTPFPAGPRYKTVAVGDSRVCALDERGEITCCGEQLTDDVPAGPFASLAVGGRFDCGITTGGSLQCWGLYAPAGGIYVYGPYAQVAVSGQTACAVRRDTGAVECWIPDQPTVLTIPPAKLRDATAIKGGIVCGATAGGTTARCWRASTRFPWPSSLPATVRRVADPSGVALSGDDACALGRSGRITCAPEARDRWTGQYRAISGGWRGICAVTVDGRVECDREWPLVAR